MLFPWYAACLTLWIKYSSVGIDPQDYYTKDEVYNKESKEAGTAEIIIGKQRNGPIGTVRLAFEGQYTRFSNLSPEYYAQYDDEE